MNEIELVSLVMPPRALKDAKHNGFHLYALFHRDSAANLISFRKNSNLQGLIHGGLEIKIHACMFTYFRKRREYFST